MLAYIYGSVNKQKSMSVSVSHVPYAIHLYLSWQVIWV